MGGQFCSCSSGFPNYLKPNVRQPQQETEGPTQPTMLPLEVAKPGSRKAQKNGSHKQQHLPWTWQLNFMSPSSCSGVETSNSTYPLRATWLHSPYYHFPQESLLHAEGPQPHCSFLLKRPFQDFKEPCCLLTASSSFSAFGTGLGAKEPQLHTVLRRQKFCALILAHKAINASSSCSLLLS